jgi:hypothetical protein
VADPKRPALKLVEIPDGYTAPANAAPAELQKAAYSRAIAEGRHRALADMSKTIDAAAASQTQAVVAQLREEHARSIKAHEKGSTWFGIAIGAAIGAIFASGGYLMVVDRAMQSAFDRAQEISAASTLVGAATQRRDETEGDRASRAPGDRP